MASRSRTSASNKPAPADSRQAQLPEPLVSLSRAHLTAAFAQALDLAEGRTPGHAGRVAYIALNLAQRSGRPQKEQRTVFYAGLLHDAGAPITSSEVCRDQRITEEALFASRPELGPQQLAMQIAPADPEAVVDALREHPEAGASVARELGFDGTVQRAIAEHHERWDGHGYPQALSEHEAGLPGRIVAAADLIESLISAQPNALAARRHLIGAFEEHAGVALEPAMAQLAVDLVRSDDFWLGLHEAEQPGGLAALCPETRAGQTTTDLETFARVFAELGDAKGEHTEKHSDRVAEVACRIAELAGLDEEGRELIRIAGLLHDVGLLGVPARVIAKPDILSLTEMETMRKHPTYSQMVLESLPELEHVAFWIGAHHERPDGKGYPEMLEEGTIPLEARILAIADTYVALTSTRPYRRALTEDDAQQVLQGGAGTQLDTRLVKLLCTRGTKATSSRSARRSPRTR